MRRLFSISTLAIAAAALAALAGARPSLAATPVASYTMTDRGAILAVFIPDGMNTLVAGLEGAQAQFLDNGVLTITGRSLPTITGKWSAGLDQKHPATTYWAKTDQITLNGLIIGSTPDGGQAALYSVQVNAPRTDASPGSGAGSLKPASFQLTQLWVPAAGGSAVGGSIILAADNAVTTGALTALAAARSATNSAPVGTYDMSAQDVFLSLFVSDGALAAITGLIGAQVLLLGNGVFTITSSSLPPITGRWSQNGPFTGFWAKTDQIEFNGAVTGTAPNGNPYVWYSVQVNAPRTDGSPGSKGGSLAPASFDLVQTWLSADGTGGILVGGSSSKR